MNTLGVYYHDTFRATLPVEGVTLVHYDLYIRDFVEFDCGNLAVEAIGDETLAEFSNWLGSVRGCGACAIANRVRLVRRIVKHATPKQAIATATTAAGKSDAPEGSLLWLLEVHYLPERPLRDRTLGMYRDALRAFDRHLGRTATLADLNKVEVNGYLVASELAGLSGRSVKGRWNVLRVLWRYAYDNELVEAFPRGIRKIKLSPIVPDAWTPAEMARLVAATHSPRLDILTGPEGRMVNVGKLLRAVVMLTYDTALRRSDVLAIERANLRDDGRLMLICEKTNQPKLCQLRSETIEALAAIAVEWDRRLIPWPRRRDRLYPFWRQLLLVAGLPTGRRQGLQKLRRTSATALESVAPGSASFHLGHRTADMARRHYLDASQLAPAMLPPAIAPVPLMIEGPH